MSTMTFNETPISAIAFPRCFVGEVSKVSCPAAFSHFAGVSLTHHRFILRDLSADVGLRLAVMVVKTQWSAVLPSFPRLVASIRRSWASCVSDLQCGNIDLQLLFTFFDSD